MSDGLSQAGSAGIDDCWNRIGVRGDFSCPELKEHIHCRNCPVYSAAAAGLLDRSLPEGYLALGTRQLAERRPPREANTESQLVFRLGAEWLALPTGVLREIAGKRAIHSIPHRRRGAVLGLANIRGELIACLGLEQLLGIEPVLESPSDRSRGQRQRARWERLLVIEHHGARTACAVDEVHGVLHFQASEARSPPATVAKAGAAYTRAVLPWQNKTIGLLDEQLLFQAFSRSLASAIAI